MSDQLLKIELQLTGYQFGLLFGAIYSAHKVIDDKPENEDHKQEMKALVKQFIDQSLKNGFDADELADLIHIVESGAAITAGLKEMNDIIDLINSGELDPENL